MEKIDKSASNFKSILLPLTGITCTNCITGIEMAVGKLPGVLEAKIDFVGEKLKVVFDSDRLNYKDLISFIGKIGFGVPSGNLELQLTGVSDNSNTLFLEKTLLKLDGVLNAVVNPGSELLRVEYIPGLADVAGISAVIKKSGFQIFEATGNDYQDDVESPAHSSELNNQKLWDQGKIVKVYGSFQDITERKLLEIERENAQNELLVAKEKAEAMSRLKSHFLANMSHELRTPLNGILGYADILVEKLEDPEVSNMAQGIYNSGKRLSETLNFILDFSVAEADKIEVFFQETKITPVIKGCIEQFEETLKKKNLTLKTEFPVEDVISSLDERLFKRIVYNLIDNAVKFTRTGGIFVKVEHENVEGTPWSVIKVKDSGIGIKKENYNLIFDDFRQVSEGISRNYEGTGLGLTITKKTVELMGGTISVESTLGEGSTFTVKFPLIQNPFHSTSLDKKDDSTRPVDSSEKRLPVALCIEDDPINRDVMVMFLNKICKVDTADSGEAAMSMATTRHYDLFLVDVNLGDSMSGMDVVKSLLDMPEYRNIPIIAVTAYSMGNERSEFLKGGCTHYIAKPFRKRELIDLVEGVLL